MFSFPDASRALRIPLESPDLSVEAAGVSIDTRTLVPGDLFAAVKGPNRDGHGYLAEAFRKGASGALIEKKYFERRRTELSQKPFCNLLAVSDTLQALTDLACWRRCLFQGRAVAVTGSVGKTSTKEFLNYLLAKKFSVLSSQGNFNNHLGLPLTLARLESGYDICLAELGANHKEEIRALAAVLKPDCGIITQISPAHLEGFGSLDEIYEAKLELFEALPQGAAAILPDDDPVLERKAKRFALKFLKVGESREADYRISDIAQEGSLVRFCLNDKWRFAFPGLARFLSRNAAMALAMAEALGVRLEDLPDIWNDFKLPSGRFQEHLFEGDIRIIFDGYNASPLAFDKALDAFSALECPGRKILVFADMLELGAEEKKYHEALGQKILAYDFDRIAAYGERTKSSIAVLKEARPAQTPCHFESSHEAAEWVRSLVSPGDRILLKASRCMKIEEVLQFLSCHLQSAHAAAPADAKISA